MKINFAFSRAIMATALLSSAVSFTSCSKEDTVNPSMAPVAETTQADALVLGTAVAGQLMSINVESGQRYYPGIISHTELASFCTFEFWQGSQLVLVARHGRLVWGDSGNNDGRYGMTGYWIPIHLAPGAYTLTVRTESDDESLMIGTTGNPATYTHAVSAPVTIAANPNPVNLSGGIYPTVQSLTSNYITSYTLNWDTSKFRSASTKVRAFAKSVSSNTLYELTPILPPYIPVPPTAQAQAFANSGQQQVNLNKSGEPDYLPSGYYEFFIDNYSTTAISGDSAPISNPLEGQ
ncbi:hypothetical protein [Hymenobacter lucidus]|uniref:DUF4397 domain-containing protein n=1 Tax=Hymenobacter lucidus TaxID=2880930 RepID=A0ABS8APC8_9BACT|nr:hypothetical protein [Hymenobacter lucidus]MCB2408065.1 hypothetical protein [Hymenobacter lucidus]